MSTIRYFPQMADGNPKEHSRCWCQTSCSFPSWCNPWSVAATREKEQAYVECYYHLLQSDNYSSISCHTPCSACRGLPTAPSWPSDVLNPSSGAQNNPWIWKTSWWCRPQEASCELPPTFQRAPLETWHRGQYCLQGLLQSCCKPDARLEP
jgi:hypothetical protein